MNPNGIFGRNEQCTTCGALGYTYMDGKVFKNHFEICPNSSVDLTGEEKERVLELHQEILSQLSANELAWSTFRKGHWTRDPPTNPGRYLIHAVQKEPGPLVNATQFVIAYKVEGKIHLTQTWGGWFWSESFPLFPNPNS